MKDKIRNVISQLEALISDEEPDANDPGEDMEQENEGNDGAQVTDMSDTFNQDGQSVGSEGQSNDKKKRTMSMMSSMLASKMKGKC